MQDREAQFLDALYLGVRDRAGFDEPIRMLHDMFGVISATLLDLDAARPDVSIHASVGVFTGEALKTYHRNFAALDPAPLAFMKLPAGTAMPTYRLLPEERRHPGEFYGDFFRPLGLEECLGGTLAAANGRFAMIGLQRSPDRHPFNDADVEKLERLMPHLGRALQLRRSFFELEGVNGALSELCDRLAAGVSVVGPTGASLFVNSGARAIAAARDGLSLDRRGRPVGMTRDVNLRLAELENDVRNGGSGGTVRVRRVGGKAPYIVLVAPFSQDDQMNDSRPRPRSVIFAIHDPLRAELATGAAIALLFGLPQATANLTAAVTTGEDLQDYADRLGISINTARYHLKTAFERIGVRSQAELSRRVITALRDLSDHRSN